MDSVHFGLYEFQNFARTSPIEEMSMHHLHLIKCHYGCTLYSNRRVAQTKPAKIKSPELHLTKIKIWRKTTALRMEMRGIDNESDANQIVKVWHGSNGSDNKNATNVGRWGGGGTKGTNAMIAWSSGVIVSPSENANTTWSRCQWQKGWYCEIRKYKSEDELLHGQCGQSSWKTSTRLNHDSMLKAS